MVSCVLLAEGASGALIVSAPAAAQVRQYPLDSPTGLQLHNVIAVLQGKKGLRPAQTEVRIEIRVPNADSKRGETFWQEDEMAGDREMLEALNVEIGDAESRGDKAFFENVLAPSFAFRRANGVVVDRQQYIHTVAASAARTTKTRSINFAGTTRAIVTCIVTMDVQGTAKDFDNLRVFIRIDDGAWKLLAWANEPA